MSHTTYAVKATKIAYSYIKQAPALHAGDFYIPTGTMLGLAGINGSGKSTLLQILACLYPPTTGELVLFGSSITGAQNRKPATNLFFLRQKISLVTQDANMQILGTTVEEDLLLSFEGCSCETGKTMTQEEKIFLAQESAATLGLARQWSTPVQMLSYGQKRKLCLAAALLRRPKLLLLDEPFSGLDYPACIELCNILTKLLQDTITIIMSSHDMGVIAHLCSSFLFLSPTLPPAFLLPKEAYTATEKYGIKPF